jgi:UDP-N-acetylmuramyl pentapeptide synthase
MKRIIKSIVAMILALLARGVILRYHPRIVLITGSVGKTSTKDAVAAVLGTRFLVRKSEKSFNSEFGVPFTILGVKNPWGHPLSWIAVFRNSLALLLLPNHYPNLLVLEVGADHPGDLAKILRIVTPDAVVVTRLPEIPVHVEAYASPEAVREEEFSPAYALAPGTPLIIPSDDTYSIEMAMRTSARTLTYGVAEDADVCISKIEFDEVNGEVVGMCAQVQTFKHENGLLQIRGSVGRTQIFPAAAAITIGIAFDLTLPESLAALETYTPPPGRARLLIGKNSSLLIDDSYNASPAAVEEALLTLKLFPHANRRIAILGDMLELGRYSVMEHERIGALARDSSDIIIVVGIRARAFLTTQTASDTSSNSAHDVLSFDDSSVAAAALSTLAQPGDVILIKGSQSVRMERIVEKLLATPLDRVHLVRQEKEWQKRSR